MNNIARPSFELEAYEDATLPTGKRLHEAQELVGHTIKCMVEYPIGRLGDWVNLVIVTETLCWLTVSGEMSGCSAEDGTHLSYSGKAYRSETEVLSDYLCPKEMLHNGLISHGQFDALQEIEGKRIEAEKAQKVAELRKELAQLEGGAA